MNSSEQQQTSNEEEEEKEAPLASAPVINEPIKTRRSVSFDSNDESDDKTNQNTKSQHGPRNNSPFIPITPPRFSPRLSPVSEVTISNSTVEDIPVLPDSSFFFFMSHPVSKQVGLIFCFLGLVTLAVGVTGLTGGGAIIVALGTAGMIGLTIGGGGLATVSALPWFFKTGRPVVPLNTEESKKVTISNR